jgi:hypothetical protein
MEETDEIKGVESPCRLPEEKAALATSSSN